MRCGRGGNGAARLQVQAADAGSEAVRRPANSPTTKCTFSRVNTSTPELGKQYAKLRLEELQCKRSRYVGSRKRGAMLPGYKFTLSGHRRAIYNQEYPIVTVEHRGNPAGCARRSEGKTEPLVPEPHRVHSRQGSLPSGARLTPAQHPRRADRRRRRPLAKRFTATSTAAFQSSSTGTAKGRKTTTARAGFASASPGRRPPRRHVYPAHHLRSCPVPEGDPTVR